MNKLNNTLTIQITNHSASQKSWYAFGYNEGRLNPPGVMVTVTQSSLNQATRQSSQQPFVIDLMKVKSQSQDQLQNPIIIRYKSSEGHLIEKQFAPADYISIFDDIPGLVKIPGINIEITGDTTLQGTIDAHTAMSIVLNISLKRPTSSFFNSAANILNDLKIKLSRALQPGTRLILK